MTITFDSDIKEVARYMLQHVQARRLHKVAHALAQIADLVWRPEVYDIAPYKRTFRIDMEYDLRPSESRSPLNATLPDGLSQTRE
jgi:hypothetical protein